MKLKTIIIITTLYATFTHTSEFSIRFAQQKDIPSIIALDREIRDEFWIPTVIAGYPEIFANNKDLFNTVFYDEWDARSRPIIEKSASNTDNKKHHILIASNEKEPDNILGFCCFKKQDNELSIIFMAVRQQARNKGIGKALLNNALSTYKDIHVCTLETLANNNESTQAFYEKYGFTTTNERCSLDEYMPNAYITYKLHLKK